MNLTDTKQGGPTGLLERIRRVHLVGIGGSGMSGIAELLANLGFDVSGSDLEATQVTDRLDSISHVKVLIGHAARHVEGAEVVVTSAAIGDSNVERHEASRLEIPIIARAQMLAELMGLREGIAVSGSHGKTTTTSMIAFVLERAGMDPTAVIGGRFSAFGSGVRLGRGRYMVVEADESDRSFLMLRPSIAIITNLDREHLNAYGSLEQLQDAFVEFANHIPVGGCVVACADDKGLRPVLSRVERSLVTYGLAHPKAALFGSSPEFGDFGGRCIVLHRDPSAVQVLGELHLQVPGRHNLLNALAAVATVSRVGVDFKTAAAALAEFRGVDRRFQVIGEAGGVLVVDDYGHHPTEIAAVLDAARQSLKRRLVVVFQPHRYSRTAELHAEFGPALAGADSVLLTEIYAAGESAIEGVSLAQLASEIREGSGRPVIEVPDLENVIQAILAEVSAGDAVLTLGAGSIAGIAPRLLEALVAREAHI